MSRRTANVRYGRMGERWAKERLEKAGWTVVDGSPGAPFDLVAWSPYAAGLFQLRFVEVKTSKNASRSRHAKLTPEEVEFRTLVLSQGATHEVLRLHRVGTRLVPLPPYSLSFSPDTEEP